MSTLFTTAAKLAVIGLIPLCMSACGHSKPSESDAKRVIQNMFSQCEPIKISSFKKLNGLPQPDGSYIVQVEFNVKYTPLPENVQNYKRFATYKSMKEEYEQNNKVASDLSGKLNMASNDDPNLPAIRAQLEKQMRIVESIANKIGQLNIGGETNFYEENRRLFYRHCSVSGSDGEKRFAVGLLEGMFPYPIDESKNHGVAFEQQYTASLAMTNSDNGWVSAGN